jgi:hypothetical protein
MISGADQGFASWTWEAEGRPAKDNRLFVKAVLYRYRAGILGVTYGTIWRFSRGAFAFHSMSQT